MPKLSSKILGEKYTIQLKNLEPSIVSVEGLVVRDDKQLSRDLQISESEVKRLKYNAALASLHKNPPISPQFQYYSADFLYRRSLREGQFILTGCSNIDHLLAGGLPLQFVTEVAGLSSSGKTQFCMTTAALAACGGVRVLYIDTQNSCSPTRLRQIISSRLGAIPAIEALRRIDIESIYNSVSLISFLYSISDSQAKLSPSSRYRFVLIDSLSSVFSSVIGREAGHCMGSSALSTACSVLSFLAQFLNASVLVSNGMVEKKTTEGIERRPTLGKNWAFAPSVRIIFSRVRSGEFFAKLDKHPRTRCGKNVRFSISDRGAED